RGWELGELLGVVLAPTLSENQAWALNKGKPVHVEHATEIVGELEGSVSKWGADPLVDSSLFKFLRNFDAVQRNENHATPHLKELGAVNEASHVYCERCAKWGCKKVSVWVFRKRNDGGCLLGDSSPLWSMEIQPAAGE